MAIKPLLGRPTGGPFGAILEDPPAMTQSFVEFTDVTAANFPTSGQMAGRDVKIVMSTTTPCTSKVTAQGTSGSPIRNLWIQGGNFSVTGDGNAALTIANWSGTCFIEGVDVDCNNGQADAIRNFFARDGACRMVIQNSRMRGMGYGATAHGDMYHSQDNASQETPVAQLLMQNCRGEIVRQGIFVPERADGHGVKRMDLDHVELVLDTRFEHASGVGVMIYASPLDGGGNQFPSDGQSYNEVWLNWYDPFYPELEDETFITTPEAQSFDGNGFFVFAAQDIIDGQIEGAPRRGNPPSTLVPLDQIGLTYNRTFFTGS